MENETTKRNDTLGKIIIKTNNRSKIKINTQTDLDKESGKHKKDKSEEFILNAFGVDIIHGTMSMDNSD